SRNRSRTAGRVAEDFYVADVADGRILTLPPQHRTSPRDRTASRPRLAARSTAQVALNLFTRAIAFGAAASRGRLAVRWQCQDADVVDEIRFATFHFLAYKVTT